MKYINRRDFLRHLALALGSGAAGWLLAACGAPVVTPSSVAPTPRPELPYLAVARGDAEPEELVKRALAALGGIERFVRPGNDVIIKPNISIGYYGYQYAATTNPWVVAALVRLARGAGAKRVRVMDFPFGGLAEEAYTRTDIKGQTIAAGGEMEVMSSLKFTRLDLPKGRDLRSCTVYGDILKADVVIDVPIAKQHSLAQMSCGMKNLMGIMIERQAMHFNLGQRTADLASGIPLKLTVVDAVRILRDNGPTGGDLNDVQKIDTIIASADVVAADSYAATLLGLRPDDVTYIKAATAMGLGRSDLAGMKIEEIRVG